MILHTWFEHLDESFSYNEVHFKKFSLPGKTCCHAAEIVTETPEFYPKYSY